MKVSERLEALRVERAQSEARRLDEGYERGDLTALRREARAEYRARLAEKVREERARLADVDRIYAEGYSLPKARAERAAEARRLLVASSGRTRSRREVAAIMGLSIDAVQRYLTDPDRTRGQAQDRARRPTAGKVRPVKPPPVRGEPDVIKPFGTMLKRRRKRGRISQVALAEAMGWDVERIRELEASETWPSPGVWVEMRRALKRLEEAGDE